MGKISKMSIIFNFLKKLNFQKFITICRNRFVFANYSEFCKGEKFWTSNEGCQVKKKHDKHVKTIFTTSHQLKNVLENVSIDSKAIELL